MTSILFGLGAAVAWGTSDFLGGRFTSRLPVFTVGLASHLAAVFLLGLAVLVARPGASADAVRWGLTAGLATSFGGLALYKGLSLGESAVVAPLSACGAVIPVAAAILTGAAPGPAALAGIALALAGVALVSLPAEGRLFTHGRHLLPVALGLTAALGFGLFFLLIDRASASDGDALVGVLSARAGAALFTAAAGALVGGLRWPGAGRSLRLASVGAIDSVANLSFALATSRGNVAIASVLGSLYPVQTLVLARLVAGEQFTRLRLAGAALALAGVALISA
ncbi:EamA family transporter [Tepidiforma thermophila]|uniref:EamA-like transporter family protein n=1 Tax=Tepidiforma thermophila (strain KCTC 52669 / CGMCC 1.13589 / G233) TaxID=2761530 RepID=A0A2A9HAY0_TEPT2|nr:EamA family transporter [Tepidiforma thermophila]PFG73104.1 EamA-like transporter family protein [Tepidiforma thermophila]